MKESQWRHPQPPDLAIGQGLSWAWQHRGHQLWPLTFSPLAPDPWGGMRMMMMRRTTDNGRRGCREKDETGTGLMDCPITYGVCCVCVCVCVRVCVYHCVYHQRVSYFHLLLFIMTQFPEVMWQITMLFSFCTHTHTHTHTHRQPSYPPSLPHTHTHF